MVLVAVVETPERGRSLVVTEAASPGTLLLAEAPFALSLLCRPPPKTSLNSSESQSNAGNKGLLGLGQGHTASTTDAFGGAVVGRCHACLAEASSTLTLKRCPKCHLVEYCSKACQAADWRRGQHRRECACLRALGSNWPQATPSLRLALKLCARIRADSVPSTVGNVTPSASSAMPKLSTGAVNSAARVSPSAFASTDTEPIAEVASLARDHLNRSVVGTSEVRVNEPMPLPSSLALASTLEGNRSAQPPKRLEHFSAAAAALVRFQTLASAGVSNSTRSSFEENHEAEAFSQTLTKEDGVDATEDTKKAKATTEEVDAWINVFCALACNAFSLVDAEMRPMPCGAIGIYPQVATINHSCSPNAVAVFHARAELQVRALRPLAAGEEVTLAYTELRRPTRMRQRALRASHCFRCECMRCVSRSIANDGGYEEADSVGVSHEDVEDDENEDDDDFGGYACPHRTPLVDADAIPASKSSAACKPGLSLGQSSCSTSSVWDAFFGHLTPSSPAKAARDPRAYDAVGDSHLAPLGRVGDVTAEGPRCGGCLTTTPKKRRTRAFRPSVATQRSAVWGDRGMKETVKSFVEETEDAGEEDFVPLEQQQDEAHMFRKWQAMQVHDHSASSERAGNELSKGNSVEGANTAVVGNVALVGEGSDAAAVFRAWTGVEVLPDQKVSPAGQQEVEAAAGGGGSDSLPAQAPRDGKEEGAKTFRFNVDNKELHPFRACQRCGSKCNCNAAALTACMKKARTLCRRAARAGQLQQQHHQGYNSSRMGRNVIEEKFSSKESGSSSEDNAEGSERDDEGESKGSSNDDDDDEVRLLQQVSVLQVWCYPRNHWRRTKVDERLLGLLLTRGDWVGALGLARGLATASAIASSHDGPTTTTTTNSSGVLPPLAALHMLMLGKLLWWLYQDPPQDPRTWARALSPTTMEDEMEGIMEIIASATPAALYAGASSYGMSSFVEVGAPAPAALLAAALRCLVSARAGLVVSHGASHFVVEEAARLAADVHAESERLSTQRSASRV